MATIDIDIRDISGGLSHSEAKSLCKELIEEGYGPEDGEFNGMDLNDILFTETHTERELVSLFKDIWLNRIFIDHRTIDEIRSNLKERRVL